MTDSSGTTKPSRAGRWIALGLLLGILAGLFFGEYCRPLQLAGDAYVGLLQMTVLPYLAVSLIAKMGRLDLQQARRLGLTMLGVLLVLWAVAIGLVVAVSMALPPIEGATFFSEPEAVAGVHQDILSRFVPTNIFRSLTEEYVPAVVVFCLFFGFALILVPGKELLLDLLDVCSDSLGRINVFLVRLAPFGLFMLTAAAAGTLRLEQLARLQAYLLLFTIACVVAAFIVLPLFVSCFTEIRYREFLRAANEPLLTALATGKLFVVLPQIVDKCEEFADRDRSHESNSAPPSVVVPLAYPVPHIGKILAFIFVSFAAWYVGQKLTPMQTASMGTTGAVSSFASPLISIPYLLDQYHLPQDLMPLFILPGFLTTRLADMVGVMHLMALTLVVSRLLAGQFRVRWRRLAATTAMILLCLLASGLGGRWYLNSTKLEYDLDVRLMSLTVPSPYENVTVYQSVAAAPALDVQTLTLERIKNHGVLRVGYHPNHLPYSYVNLQGDLVGLDVELMHRLASRLRVRLEFVPYTYDSVVEQLEAGGIDLAIGGLIMNPERLLKAGFTQPYQTATIAILVRDYRRKEITRWDVAELPKDLRLGVAQADIATAARRQLPGVDIEVVESIGAFFDKHEDLDGLVLAAEEAAAWNILHPEFAVVVPEPIVQRPVGFAVRPSDPNWLSFLDRWLDIERMDGSLVELRAYWVEGGGTHGNPPRWSVVRNLLHWVP